MLQQLIWLEESFKNKFSFILERICVINGILSYFCCSLQNKVNIVGSRFSFIAFHPWNYVLDFPVGRYIIFQVFLVTYFVFLKTISLSKSIRFFQNKLCIKCGINSLENWKSSLKNTINILEIQLLQQLIFLPPINLFAVRAQWKFNKNDVIHMEDFHHQSAEISQKPEFFLSYIILPPFWHQCPELKPTTVGSHRAHKLNNR